VPVRAERRQAWKDLGVDGPGIADHAPGPGHPDGHLPRLTLRMVARLQGFPGTWEFSGGKTAASADRAAVPAGRPASPRPAHRRCPDQLAPFPPIRCRSRAGPGLRLNAAGRLPRRSASGSPDRRRGVIMVVLGRAVRPAWPGLGQPDRYADPGRPARRGDLRHPPRAAPPPRRYTCASSSVVVGHAAPTGSAWLPSAWHRGPCPCGHCALPGDAALNRAAYYRHVAAP